MTTLSFEPLISLALWLPLAAAGLALLAWYGCGRPAGLVRRRWGCILALMGTGLLLILTVLLNPTWVAPVTPPEGKPLLTILLDVSASMSAPDAPAGQTRYQAAARLAEELASASSKAFDVRLLTFAEAPTAADFSDLAVRSPQGQGTDLAAAVTGAVAEERSQGQAVVLLSDGIHNAGSSARPLEAARLARALACPVHTCTVGGDAVVKDLALALRSPQELAYVGQKVAVVALLRQRGLAGAHTQVSLLHDGKEVERRQVPLPAQEVTEVGFQVAQEKIGLYRYEVRAAPLPGEVSLANNAAPLLLRVVNEPLRILVLEGKPYWDHKFLLRTLHSDASVELDGLVRMSENRLFRRTLKRARNADGAGTEATAEREDWKVLSSLPEFLASGDGLRAYQVVVLGRDAEVFLTEPVLAQLRAWLLRDGGCLLCYRGQPTAQVNQRLGALLPVRWAPARESRFHLSLTERGRDLRWFPASDPGNDALDDLPTLATTSRPEQPRPLAVVLATSGSALAGDSPAVTYQPYGAGRVVVIEGSGMWRWAFLPPDQARHDEVYRGLWHGLVRWLASSAALLPGQKLALRSDKVSFAVGEPVTATLLLRDEAARDSVPEIELRGNALEGARTVAPSRGGDERGAYRVVFGKLPEGQYQARLAGPAGDDPAGGTAFDVRSLSEEQLDLRARPDLMARIARESGGQVLEPGDGRDLARQVQEQLDRGRAQTVRRTPAWDRWWVMVVILGVWGLAWGVRRSGGLV